MPRHRVRRHFGMLYARARRHTKRKTVFPFPTRPQAQQDQASQSQSKKSIVHENNMDPNTGTRDDIDNNPTMRTRRLPPWIASPAIEEGFETESSVLQQETADECLPLLQALTSSFNDVGLPPIVREKHIRFLRRSLGRLPGAFASLDASKPWMLYWALNGLALLGEDMGKFKHR